MRYRPRRLSRFSRRSRLGSRFQRRAEMTLDEELYANEQALEIMERVDSQEFGEKALKAMFGDLFDSEHYWQWADVFTREFYDLHSDLAKNIEGAIKMIKEELSEGNTIRSRKDW